MKGRMLWTIYQSMVRMVYHIGLGKKEHTFMNVNFN